MILKRGLILGVIVVGYTFMLLLKEFHNLNDHIRAYSFPRLMKPRLLIPLIMNPRYITGVEIIYALA